MHHKIGGSGSRYDAADPHAMLLQFDIEALGKTQYAPLRRRIHRPGRPGMLGAGRCYVDDGPTATFFHHSSENPASDDHAVQVERDDLPDVIDRLIDDIADGNGTASIVDQNIKLSPGLADMAGRRFPGSRIGDIHDQPPRTADFPGRGFKGGPGPSGNQHGRPGFDKTASHRLAIPCGPARHPYCLAGQGYAVMIGFRPWPWNGPTDG